MKNFFALLLFLQISPIFSQQNYYWIKFKDKSNSTFSFERPNEFLSQKAVERRRVQNIEIDHFDLPITPSYIAGVLPFVTKLKHQLKWFNIAIVKIDLVENIDSIRQLPFVDSIALIEYLPARSFKNKFEEQYYPVDQNLTFPNKYGTAFRQIEMLNGDLLHQLNHTGQGKTIAVMDNGFYNVDTISAFNYIRPRILYTHDFVNNESNVYNDGSHGTNVLSCIGGSVEGKFLGTAPDANYFLMVTEDDNAEWVMEEYNWAAAAEWADSAGADIFSTSLGYTNFDNDRGSHQFSDLDGNKTVITYAGNLAFSRGILVVTSAGNEGSGAWYHISAPADGYNILAIGAVDTTRRIASFSGRGPNSSGRIKPDVCALGIRSAVVTNTGNLAFSGGTSFSCPILAGCAASLWSAFPDKTSREIYDVILASGDRLGAPNNDYGFGIPNFYNAYLYLKTDFNDKVLKMNDNITVFPNPFSNELYASLYNDSSTLYRLEIFDFNGEKVVDKEIFVRQFSFDVIPFEEATKLLPGQYLLRLNGDKKKTFRLVKQL
jgi:hypothetical protein